MELWTTSWIDIFKAIINPLHTVINCGGLSAIPNGAVDTSGGTNYKCTAVYTCNTGYVLNGMVARTCQEDGMWSGSEPTCDGMCNAKYLA